MFIVICSANNRAELQRALGKPLYYNAVKTESVQPHKLAIHKVRDPAL